MTRLLRNLMITGVGLVAGATTFAAPAVASAPAQGNGHDQVIGYLDSHRKCDFIGWRGVARGGWEDYHCFRVRRGEHRGDWALWVDFGRDRGGNGGNHGGDGDGNHGGNKDDDGNHGGNQGNGGDRGNHGGDKGDGGGNQGNDGGNMGNDGGNRGNDDGGPHHQP